MTSKNISVVAHEDCCGCMVCNDVCPVNCITFHKDSEGFYYPKVDEAACISCGKCQLSCPQLKPSFNNIAKSADAAFATIPGVRYSGSSGGVFGLIANEVLLHGGQVYGAAFTNDLKLVHSCAANCEDLQPLLRSKYIQSDTRGCYKQVVDDVRRGLQVLFSGTPCQCNAIRNAVGPHADNLLTIEVVCHGVPSQDLFDKTIKWIEEQKHCSITSFSFRSKFKKALHPQAFTYVANVDGKTKVINGLHYQNPYYFGFQKYITLRPSCYKCQWARPERTADITLGDFWGIEKYDASLDAKTGISQVIINTEKGRKLFDKVLSSNLLWHKEFPIDVAIDNNGCLKSPTRLKPERQRFFKALASEPFDLVVRQFLTPKRKWVFNLYYGMPGFLRRIVRKMMDKKMRYE